MEDAAWRAGRSLGSAQASDMAAVGTTGLAPDLAQSAPLVLRGVTPSAEARAARRICETPVPRRRSSWWLRFRSPAQLGMQVPQSLLLRSGLARQPAPVSRAWRRWLVWLVRHRLPQARAAEAAAPAPTLLESPRATSHRCIWHSCDRRSGSAQACRARPRSTLGWAVAAPWRGSDNRTSLRRRDSGCWASFPDRGRSCSRPSNHARSRPDYMHRARALLPEWRAGMPRTGRNGVCPST